MTTPRHIAEARFWTRVDKEGPIPAHRPELGPCWLYKGKLDRRGYGRVIVEGTTTGAHRLAYRLLVGPIPDGLELDHLCRVHGCVNPEHVEAVTHRENQRRGIKGALTTHCPRGHPYDEANTIINSSGRQCRACVRARKNEAGRRQRDERQLSDFIELRIVPRIIRGHAPPVGGFGQRTRPAVCECGAASASLPSVHKRRAWYQAHLEAVMQERADAL